MICILFFILSFLGQQSAAHCTVYNKPILDTAVKETMATLESMTEQLKKATFYPDKTAWTEQGAVLYAVHTTPDTYLAAMTHCQEEGARVTPPDRMVTKLLNSIQAKVPTLQIAGSTIWLAATYENKIKSLISDFDGAVLPEGIDKSTLNKKWSLPATVKKDDCLAYQVGSDFPAETTQYTLRVVDCASKIGRAHV